MVNVEVKASTIAGLGLFARQAFKAGEVIRKVHVLREISLVAPLDEQADERVEHCAYPDGKVVLWGFPDRHVNHSCDPNAYERHEGEAVYIVARRAIAAGEELTFDYNMNTSGGDSWYCRCGSARCRGETIADFFSLPRVIQYEYRPLLADWFIRRHKEKIAALDTQDSCPFCHLGKDAYGELITTTSHCYMLSQPDPVLRASVMILPIRHVVSPFDLTEAEWLDMKQLLAEAKGYLNVQHPEGWNVGWNVGEVAGQHIEHAHLHVIGRFADEPLAGKGIRYAFKQPDNTRPQ